MFTNPPLFPLENSGIMRDSPEIPLCGQRSEFMDQFRNKSGYICDMDGVISVSYTHLTLPTKRIV